MRSRQRGVALLIIALILSLATVGFFFSRFSARNIEQERAVQTAAALAQAKTALIGRALADTRLPGSLPCPDTDNDGSTEILDGTNCQNYIGRLPWRTLRLPDLRDGSGERLWYVLSRNFRDAANVIINSDTPGQLSISGSYSAANVIAIVFAPGSILSGQQRDTANVNSVINYLEGSNALGGANTNFTTAASSSTFNDQLLTITSNNLIPLLEKRVARQLATALRTYNENYGRFPYAAPLNESQGGLNNTRGRIPNASTEPNLTLPPWFPLWNDIIYYTLATPAQALTVDTITNVSALVITAGPLLPGTTCNTTDSRPQSRPSINICDYLDSAENTNGDNIYRTAPPSAVYNDQIFIVAP